MATRHHGDRPPLTLPPVPSLPTLSSRAKPADRASRTRAADRAFGTRARCFCLSHGGPSTVSLACGSPTRFSRRCPSGRAFRAGPAPVRPAPGPPTVPSAPEPAASASRTVVHRLFAGLRFADSLLAPLPVGPRLPRCGPSTVAVAPGLAHPPSRAGVCRPCLPRSGPPLALRPVDCAAGAASVGRASRTGVRRPHLPPCGPSPLPLTPATLPPAPDPPSADAILPLARSGHAPSAPYPPLGDALPAARRPIVSSVTPCRRPACRDRVDLHHVASRPTVDPNI
jgi:hypothetical protein